MANKELDVDFELWVATYYKNKAQSCRDKGIAFNLNLTSVRNLLSAKVCGYTGMPLTIPNRTSSVASKFSDITIDRIDNSRPYEKGNVIAVSYGVNNFKSMFENPLYSLDMETAKKALVKMQKKIAQCKENNK